MELGRELDPHKWRYRPRFPFFASVVFSGFVFYWIKDLLDGSHWAREVLSPAGSSEFHRYVYRFHFGIREIFEKLLSIGAVGVK